MGKKPWEVAISHLERKSLEMYEELSRAVYSEGIYQLSPKYFHLKIQPYEWVSLSIPERKALLDRLNLRNVSQSVDVMSVSAGESGIQGYSLACLEKVWENAYEIMSCNDSIVYHPKKPELCVVFDTEKVYHVKKVDTAWFSCSCEQNKSFANLFCKHTIAVAEKGGCLLDFIPRINAQISAQSIGLSKSLMASCYSVSSGEKHTKKRRGKNNNVGQNLKSSSPQHIPVTSTVSKATVAFPSGSGPACARDMSCLPPRTPLQVSVREEQPVSLTFRQGLIKRCYGCQSDFAKQTSSPPHDLILKKKDYREYFKDGGWYRSYTLSNTYHHLKVECVRMQFPHFELKLVKLFDEKKESLLPCHIELLHKRGLHIACSHMVSDN